MESPNSVRRITRRYNVSTTEKSPISISQNERDLENEIDHLSSSYSEDVFTNSRVTTSSIKQRKSKILRHNTSDYSSEENEESSYDKRHSSNRNGNVHSSEDLSNHKPYKLYKEAGEYWNKYPKTDYTYSRYSPHRRELEPGAIIMPNMSRRSIHSEERTLSDSKSNSVFERTHLSRNYHASSDLPKRRLEEFWGRDEVDYKISETLIQKILRITRITLIYTVITNYFHSLTTRKLSGRSYIRNYKVEQKWYEKIWSFISSILAKIGSAYYTLLGSVLLLDSWLLRRENRSSLSSGETAQNLANQISEDRWKTLRRLGSALLILLLLLLGWYFIPDNTSNSNIIQKSMSPIFSGYDTSISYIKYESSKVLENVLWPFSTVHEYVVDTSSFITANYFSSPESQIEYILEWIVWPFQFGYEHLSLGLSKIYDCLLWPLKFISTLSLIYQNIANGFMAIISWINSCYDEYITCGAGAVLENVYWLLISTYQSLGNILFGGMNSLLSIIYSIPGFLYLSIDYVKYVFVSDTIEITEKKIIQESPEIILSKKSVTLSPIIEEKYLQKEFDTKQITENIIKELNKKIESSSLTEDDVKRLISNELNLINFKIDQHSKLIENHKNLITTLVAGLDDIKNFQKIEINNYLHAEIQKIYQQTQQEKVIHTKVNINDDELNAIKSEIKQIKDEINKLNADKTGLPDFALEPSGGQVISTRCTESYNAKTAVISVFGIPLWYPSNTPRVVINQGVVPGECWAFQGFPGFLVIKLSTRVHIHTFSLEHIPKEISPTGHIDSAPQNFSVWGLVNETERNPLKLGQYTYDANGDALQYFSVKSVNPVPAFEMVELRIESNHGNIKFTCLYRFRVHGSIANDTPPPP